MDKKDLIKKCVMLFLLILGGSCYKDTTSPPIAIPKYGLVHGYVLDQEFQEPVPGALVLAVDNQKADTTDSSGVFRLDSLAVGLDTLRVSEEKYYSQSTVVDITADTLFQDFLLQFKTGADCVPALDTNYIYERHGYIYELCPKAIYARFQPWVTDTNLIRQTIAKYNLRTISTLYTFDDSYEAVLCITDDSRAECYFTPWGKSGFHNFGADSTVQYVFGIFENGYISFSGDIIFIFREGITSTEIDSFFTMHGLRFLYTAPGPQNKTWYVTVITSEAVKNPFELYEDLESNPLLDDIYLEITSHMIPVYCCY